MKKILNEINQHLKTFANEYIFISKNNNTLLERRFIVKDEENAFSVIYEYDNISGDLFDTSFKILDAKELFYFLRASKKVTYDIINTLLVNEKNESFSMFKIIESSSELSKELRNNFKFTLDNASKIMASNKIIDGENNKLLVNNEVVYDEVTPNNIVDALKNNISDLSNHTLCFSQVNDNSLNLYSEFAYLDLTQMILILPTRVFRKLKMLKKDEAFFNIYSESSGGIVLNYGIVGKEQFTIVCNILFDIIN